MRTVLSIAIVFGSITAGSITAVAIAQNTAFLETRDGIRELDSRVRQGMPIAEAQRELESLGFSCQPGRSNSDFGPIDAIATPFIYCERREPGKDGIVKRWQAALSYNHGTVSGTHFAWNPTHP